MPAHARAHTHTHMHAHTHTHTHTSKVLAHLPPQIGAFVRPAECFTAASASVALACLSNAAMAASSRRCAAPDFSRKVERSKPSSPYRLPARGPAPRRAPRGPPGRRRRGRRRAGREARRRTGRLRRRGRHPRRAPRRGLPPLRRRPHGRPRRGRRQGRGGALGESATRHEGSSDPRACWPVETYRPRVLLGMRFLRC